MIRLDKNGVNDVYISLREYIREAVIRELDMLDPVITMKESTLRSILEQAVYSETSPDELLAEAKSDKSKPESQKKRKKKKKKRKKEIARKRQCVMTMLDNPALNHAELMRKLWHPRPEEEDSMRSLFSKMATGKPDADGVVRQFSDEEIVSLYNILRNINK